MAGSPSHKFGQIIGNLIQDAITAPLAAFAAEFDLYLDTAGVRAARRGRKVTWTDSYGNAHDLDFVLERGGSEEELGVPIAFVEVAWRRYTRHSRNKAQEIQGALLPLAETYRDAAPFIGAVLAGEFTGGAVDQLRSLGFNVLHFPYPLVIQAFATVQIDAHSEDGTPDAEYAKRVAQWEALSGTQREAVSTRLLDLNRDAVTAFVARLQDAAERRIVAVVVLPLHGTEVTQTSIDDAIHYIASYAETESDQALVRYEVEARYSNGDRVRGEFSSREESIRFLRHLQ